MATIVEYTNRKPPRNGYPRHIVSPSHAGPAGPIPQAPGNPSPGRPPGAHACRYALWRWRDGWPFGRHASTRDGLRILVICAACRRVRNATGDWATVPEAWWPRPHVLRSHGSCPLCFARVLVEPAGPEYACRGADQAERLRALATEVTLAEQRERRRLATVLHDEHQQLLVAAKLQVTRLERTGDAGAQAASRELAALLEQVLARNRSLTQELSPPVLQTGRLVPAIEWLAGRMAETHKLQIVVEADAAVVPGAEELTVLLFQAVRELLFNVVKHAQVTTARVEIALREGQARIEVSDAGVGFDPTSPRVEGGFGLVSIRQRLEALGGRLEIDSTPGRGSRVTLWAPVQQAPVLAPPVPVEIAPPESASSPAARPPAPGRTGTIRILVVDDHQLVRQGLIRLLTAEPDLEIVGEAANGQTAVELTQQLGPDVVLMDVSMPVMNGFEATRLIHARYPTARVIGLSMFEEAEQGQAMRAAGAAAYLSKSRAPEALVAAIRACVESTREGEAR